MDGRQHHSCSLMSAESASSPLRFIILLFLFLSPCSIWKQGGGGVLLTIYRLRGSQICVVLCESESVARCEMKFGSPRSRWSDSSFRGFEVTKIKPNEEK